MIAHIRAMLLTEAGRRRFNRISTLAVLAIAAFTRLVNLGHPNVLVFDETYYVKDAWTLSSLGYEAQWPWNSDDKFNAGKVNGFKSTPSFVVHPPLGKWLIAVGMRLFGAENPWSWRIMVALSGIALVWLTMLITSKLLKSQVWGAVAGLLLAIDGQAIVMSRNALLDGFLATAVALAFWFVWLDQERFDPSKLWRRPWLLAAGIALGAAMAIKWSGLYFLAAIGLYTVLSQTISATRHDPLDLKLSSRVFGKLTVSNFLHLVPAALATYLASWSGWLFTSGGYDRGSDSNPLIALWNFHVETYNFHVGLRTPHSYAANPLTWLFMNRPTSFYYIGKKEGEFGCELANGCSQAITAVPNVLIWYSAIAAVLWLLFHYVVRRQRAAGFVLLGVAAGYLPWLAFLDRTVFQFYTIVFEPFLIMALVFAFATYVRNSPRNYKAGAIRRITWFLAVALALSAFFFTIWTGIETPEWFWRSHMWLPSWI